MAVREMNTILRPILRSFSGSRCPRLISRLRASNREIETVQSRTATTERKVTSENRKMRAKIAKSVANVSRIANACQSRELGSEKMNNTRLHPILVWFWTFCPSRLLCTYFVILAQNTSNLNCNFVVTKLLAHMLLRSPISVSLRTQNSEPCTTCTQMLP